MANEEQEINQQPEINSQDTGPLDVNTSKDPSTPAEDTPTVASSESATPAELQSDDAPVAPMAEAPANPQPEAEPVAAMDDEAPATEAVVAEEPSAPAAASLTEAKADDASVVEDTAPAEETPVVADEDVDTAEVLVEAMTDVEQPEAEQATEQPADAETATEPVADATPQPPEEPTAETPDAPASEPMEAEPTAALTGTESPIAEHADIPEPEDDISDQPAVDYSQFSKQDFVNLLETQMATISVASVTPGDFKKADQLLKEVKPLFDKIKRSERETALQAYVAETESEEGFTYKYDDLVQRFDELYKQIKSQKNTHFQNLDKAKDSNFTAKTDLLTRLRELVEGDENNAGDQKVSWNEFKKIQDEWKAAGNINSPHNATLWATYHALVDRYYSNRNIYFELKELDRKRNITLKTEVIEKVEAMAASSEETTVTRQTIDEANTLFEEYKHIGPAPKAEQEVLWGRMKAALDVLYDKRRGQTNDQRKESAQLYEEKSAIYEELLPHTSFTSSSINDWNDRTKVVMALQDRWNGIKGPMPRDEGKELSRKFWGALKTFFHNKGEFFKQLEGKREENLRAKNELCEQVESILAADEDNPAITQTVIELQRQWKNVGQVPERQKNAIFDRFKTACDAFFNKKRSKNQETDQQFDENLTKKIALIERIEAAASANADLSELNEFKKEWNAIGFVPKKDKDTIQKRYIGAVNALVSATGKIPAKDKEQIMLQSEAEVTRSGSRNDGSRNDGSRNDGSRSGGSRNDRRSGGDSRGGNRSGGYRSDDTRGGGYERDYNRDGGGSKRESDIRRRITSIENDIATLRNNIEFFARSKNADQLRADIDKKIADAEKQIESLRNQLEEEQA